MKHSLIFPILGVLFMWACAGRPESKELVGFYRSKWETNAGLQYYHFSRDTFELVRLHDSGREIGYGIGKYQFNQDTIYFVFWDSDTTEHYTIEELELIDQDSLSIEVEAIDRSANVFPGANVILTSMPYGTVSDSEGHAALKYPRPQSKQKDTCHVYFVGLHEFIPMIILPDKDYRLVVKLRSGFFFLGSKSNNQHAIELADDSFSLKAVDERVPFVRIQRSEFDSVYRVFISRITINQ